VSARTNHPLKTLLLLCVVAGVGWLAYEFIYKRGILKGHPEPTKERALIDETRSTILEAFEHDLCLMTLDEIVYRANEDHYRIRVTVSQECTEQARDMCREIAELAADVLDTTVGVFAYDQAGNPVAKFIQ